MKRGPWFPANVKPVHVGWYETRLYSGRSAVNKAYWNGRFWIWPTTARVGCVFQNRRWRGVVK